MVTRREDVELRLIATDKASSVVQGVADEVSALEKQDAVVELTAQDKASADVATLRQRLSSLSGDEYKAVLTAEAGKLRREVDQANRLLAKVDGEKAEAVLDAKDLASAKLDAIQAEIATLDNASADATVEVTDNASGDLDRVDGKLDKVDRRTTDATVDAHAGPGLTGVLDSLNGLPGNLGNVGNIVSKMVSPGGALVGLVGLLAGAAVHSADVAVDANTMATLFNTTPEAVSGLAAVLEQTANVEAKDLQDIIVQMAGALEQTPALADQLGITLDEVRADPVAAFIKAIDNIAADGVFDFAEMQAASKAFGEEGVRQVAAVVAALGPDGLSGDIAALPKALLITPEEVDRAIEFRRQISRIGAEFGGIVQDIGAPALEILTPVLGIISEIAGVIPTITQPLRDLISGEQLGIGEATDEFKNFIQLLAGGAEQAGAWQTAFGNMEGFEDFQGDVQQVNDFIARGIPLGEAMAEVFGVEGQAAVTLANLLGIVGDETDEVAEAAQAAADSTQEHVDQLRDQADALEDSADALTDQSDAYRDNADAILALQDANQDATDAQNDYNSAVAEFGEDSADAQSALRDLQNAAIGVADAQVELARTTAAKRGETLSAAAAIDVENRSLLDQARNMQGPARTAILQRIADLNDIPSDVMTQIEAAVEAGDIEEAERLIQSVSGRRKLAIQAELDTASAATVRSQADKLAATKDMVVRPVLNAKQFNNDLLWLLRPRDLSAKIRGHAHGTRSAPAGLALVGEEGPELVDFGGGEQVVPAGETSRLLAGGARVVQNIVNNFPAGVNSRDVAAAQRRYALTQGGV